jgi:hypothetical protein
VSCGDDGKQLLASRAVGGALGVGQRESAETVGELGGDAWGQGRQVGASGGTARRPTVALRRGRGEAEEEEEGGVPGAKL